MTARITPKRMAAARASAAITVMAIAVPLLAAGPAFSGCAEDLTRIALALPSASPDIRAAAGDLLITAQARAKAKDGNGCSAATAEALRLLNLPNLAPLTLSTPVPGTDRQPQPPQASVTLGQGTQGQGSAKAPSKTAGQGNKKQSAKSAAKAKADPAPAPDWYVVTSDVVGNEVTAQDRPDQSIGTIKALVIDSTTRQTTLALIETGGFFGIDGKLVAVPFAALHFSARGDRPTIRAKLATVKGTPAVTADTVVALVADAKWRADLAKRFRVTIAPPSPRDVASKSVGKTGAKSAPGSTVGLAPAGDAAAGGAYVQGICGACHTFDQGGGTRVGPNLYGIVDRTIAGAAGFSYSSALKSHGGIWTAVNLDAFLKNPQGFARGTTMPFAGIASDNERRNVIAYLESLGTAQGGQK